MTVEARSNDRGLKADRQDFPPRRRDEHFLV